MPNRKRARVSVASTPAADSQPRTPVDAQPPAPSLKTEDVVDDPWTDEQESSLFKCMVQWKPTGLHRHFRMISILESLRSQGYSGGTYEHMRAAGIWAKLGTLYDLEALDEREDLYAFGDDDPTDISEAEELPLFTLPESDFSDQLWERRLAPSGSSSPISVVEPQRVAASAGTKQSARGRRAGDGGSRVARNVMNASKERGNEALSNTPSAAEDDGEAEEDEEGLRSVSQIGTDSTGNDGERKAGRKPTTVRAKGKPVKGPQSVQRVNRSRRKGARA